MSPEQARGEAIDRSVDIWAYGVVIYEMLTGHLLFARRSAAETISAVLSEEPDCDRIPEGVRRLGTRCLAKDPAKRLRDIGDARLLLEDQPTAAPVQKSNRLAWTSAAIASLLAAGAVVGAVANRQLLHLNRVRFHITTDVALPGERRVGNITGRSSSGISRNRSRRHAARVGPGSECPGRPRSSRLEARPGSGPAFLVSRQSVHCLRRRRRAQKKSMRLAAWPYPCAH